MRIAALAAAVVFALTASAGAALTPAQKLFTQKLLASNQVGQSVKTTLKKGGFVSSSVLFGDVTGDGKDDAIVTVDSGGSAGIIALYVFSSGAGKNLTVVYRNEHLYRGTARLDPGPTLVYFQPHYAALDELCCPSSYRESTLQWSAKSKSFHVVQRRTVSSP